MTGRLLAAAGALGAVVIVPGVLMRAQTRGDLHPATSVNFRPADAALVLGARVWPDGRPSRFLRQRVEAGVALYRAGFVSRLVMSGGGADSSGHGEPAVMRRTALELGVPGAVIDDDPDGINSLASAVNAAAAGLTSVIVCSQEFHLPRAVWLCRRVGLEAQGAFPPILPRPDTLRGYVREVPATWKAVSNIAVR